MLACNDGTSFFSRRGRECDDVVLRTQAWSSSAFASVDLTTSNLHFICKHASYVFSPSQSLSSVMAVVICPPCSPHCFSCNVTAGLQKTSRDSRTAIYLAFSCSLFLLPEKSTMHNDILPLKGHLAALSKNTNKVLPTANAQKLTPEQIMLITRQAVQQLRRLAWPQCNTGKIYSRLEQILKKNVEAEKDKRTLLWVLFSKTDQMKYEMTTWVLPNSWIASKKPFCCSQQEMTQTNVANHSIS